MLTDTALAEIKRLRDTAESGDGDKLSLNDVLTQRLVDRAQVGEIEVDGVPWIIGYSIEQHPGGSARHLSISHIGRRMLPGVDITKRLLEEFCFDMNDAMQPSVAVYPSRGLTAHILQYIKLLG